MITHINEPSNTRPSNLSNDLNHLQAHLLTLRREVRDLIYDHLAWEVELRGIDKIDDTRVIITLDNAPYANILLTHLQLHDKYKESGGSLQQSATVIN
jgi:hypothetical protein